MTARAGWTGSGAPVQSIHPNKITVLGNPVDLQIVSHHATLISPENQTHSVPGCKLIIDQGDQTSRSSQRTATYTCKHAYYHQDAIRRDVSRQRLPLNAHCHRGSGMPFPRRCLLPTEVLGVTQSRKRYAPFRSIALVRRHAPLSVLLIPEQMCILQLPNDGTLRPSIIQEATR